MLLGANYGDKVIPLSPTLLVCYVWLLQMLIFCVFFPMQGISWERVKNSVRNHGRQNIMKW
jgi:hypothetical protein